MNCKDVESLGVELLNNKKKNTLFNVLYRPPNGKIEIFENFLKHLFNQNKNSNKTFHIAGDFNLNLLDHNENKKVQNFLNIIYQNGMLPTINKPTRVTRKTATAIDHIITNDYIESLFKTAIIKSDISDHFPICIFFPSNTLSTENQINYQYKRTIDSQRIAAFYQKLFENDWNDIVKQNKPNEAYDLFIKHFCELYDIYFPIKKIKIKAKDLKSPWITKGLKKSSKRKQKLYEKSLKKRNEKAEKEYRDYKKLFESLKKRSKRMYYSNLILKYKNNIKKTWQIIKEALGKEKCSNQSLPKTVLVNEVSITQNSSIAENFNKYFTEIGPNLAKKIGKSNKHFAQYLYKHVSELSEHPLSINELKDAFFALKINKSAGYDNISFNIVKKCFGVLHKPLLHIFNLSLQTGIFPEKLKIAGVLPSFKGGDNRELGNYRPISVLPCFSKILEKIMYNRLYKYLTINNILYKKQFGFQKSHSTEHAIMQLVDQINNSFEHDQYTLGVFIDLSKAFDTVDHEILIAKLENYGIKGNNLNWFKSYLKNRKQFIRVENISTDFQEIVCGVPQGSILGPLLFLIYINDLKDASNILNSIMFADDTNLFYSHRNIETLFSTMNIELENINEWFKANKLSLNVKKTKFILFYKKALTKSGNVTPLNIPSLQIGNKNIERVSSIKFLGVMLDEHLSWKEHIKVVENKLAKNIGLLYRVNQYLNESSLKSVYFSYIHSYLNYANIAWASTYPTSLQRIHLKQKHAVRIVYNKDKLSHSKPLLRNLNALNVYQINIYQHLGFMHRFNNDETPKVFNDIIKRPEHRYPTSFSSLNFTLKPYSLNSTKYSISFRGPKLWNDIPNKQEKEIKSSLLFQKKMKSKLLDNENETDYF